MVLPVGVTQHAIDDTPKLNGDRFMPVVRIGEDQIYGDLGVEKVELPALDVGRGDFAGLATPLWWHPLQLYQFLGIEWAIHRYRSLDSYLRDIDEDSVARTNQYRAEDRRQLSSRVSNPDYAAFRRVLALLLIVEPCVHGSIRYGIGQSMDDYYQWREQLLEEDLLARTGLTLEEASDWHEKLSLSAHLHDPLRAIRPLVNQIDPKRRRKMQGRALRADVGYSHAETLRRHLEWSHGVMLLEEDDYQMREFHQRFKEDAFGNRRVLDGQREVLRRINRHFGIDHAECVALLLEGPTELAFFESVAQHWGINLASYGIVLYDLGSKDQFGKNRMTLQQLEVLKKHEIFAYAALDEDRGGDHLRSLNKKAREGLLSAGFTIWQPDFEGHNFSSHELIQAATIVAREQGMDVEFPVEELELLMHEKGIPVGTAIVKLASSRRVYMTKGSAWGQALAQVACVEGLVVPDEVKDENGERPALALLEMLIRGHDADYALSVEHTMAQHHDGRQGSMRVTPG